MGVAARAQGLINMLTVNDVATFSDKAYQGASGAVRTPFKRCVTRPTCHAGRRWSTGSTPCIRVLSESSVSLLKGWKLLAKIRCCPRRATAIIGAILVLRHIRARQP